MQSVDGDEEEQPSATPSPLTATSRSSSSASAAALASDQRPAASKHSASNLPPLVPADAAEQPESEPVELIRFREQWRTELKREQSGADASPGATSGRASTSAAAGGASPSAGARAQPRVEEKQSSLRAAEEWKRQKDLDSRNSLLISRENVDPLPFAVSPDEPLTILALTPVEALHIGSIPDEVLIYLLCFLDAVSLARVALSCKKTYSVTREPVLWRIICQRIWPLNCTRDVYQKYGTWQRMFLTRPKARYDGIYVSKNSYLRAGSTEWAYNQPVHQVIYYRYLRLLPDGRALYAMALEQPRKVLKWFNPRTVELEKDKQKGRDPRSTAASSSSPNVPSVGTYTLEDVSGAIELWIQGKDMVTQQFAGTLRRKQGGRFIGISIHKYLSTSKTGITTDFDTVPIAPFHFYKLAPHVLDPRDETHHQ